MPSEPSPASAPRASPVLHLAGWMVVAAALGLVELAVRRAGGLAGPAGSGAALVAWHLGASAALGLGLGVAAWVARSIPGPWRPCSVRRLALLIAAFGSAWAFGELDAGGPPSRRALAVAAALALGAAVFALARRALDRVPALAGARVWIVAGGLAAVALFALGTFERPRGVAPSGASRSDRPSLLLVTIDTLRADHVGAYGHAAARTPVMDGLAREGVLFENAVVPSIWTGPSHVSILTGLLPAHHGVLENLQTVPPSVPTVAETLSARGYSTAAFVASAPVSERGSRLLERFAVWDDDLRAPYWPPRACLETTLGRVAERLLGQRAVRLRALWRPAERVTDVALDWLDGPGDASFFCWVHYFDPHLPYRAPERFLSPAGRAWTGPRLSDWGPMNAELRRRVVEEPELLAHMGELYDAEVAHADFELGRLLEAARRRAGPAGLWIVVTADHGESFGEHGLYFVRDLYEPSLRVPLIVVPPAGATETLAGRRVAPLVRAIDLAPTLLDLLGCGGALTTDGVSLRPLLEEPRASGVASSVASILPLQRGDPTGPVLAVRTDRWKSIWRLPGWFRSFDIWSGERRELYDLERDRAELVDVAAEHPEVLDELWPLAREQGMPAVLEEHRPDAQALEALRDLGYTR